MVPLTPTHIRLSSLGAFVDCHRFDECTMSSMHPVQSSQHVVCRRVILRGHFPMAILAAFPVAIERCVDVVYVAWLSWIGSVRFSKQDKEHEYKLEKRF